MSNYIKIPLASNPGRAFRSTSITIAGSALSDADPASPATVAGGAAGGTSATAQSTVVPTGGAGATFTGATGSGGSATLADLTLTVAAVGDNYKVGDVITVAAATTGTETTWSEAIKFTVTADMLEELDAAIGNEQIIPIDDIISVESVSSGGTLVDNKLFISTKVASGSTATNNSHIEFAGWTVDFEDSTYNQANCIASISEAIAKAASAVNSQPEVVWFGGAEVIDIVYGKNPTTV